MTIGELILIQLFILWTFVAFLKLGKYKFNQQNKDGRDAIVILHWIYWVIALVRFIVYILEITEKADWWNYKLF